MSSPSTPAPTTSGASDQEPDRLPGSLFGRELWWRDQYNWLKEAGYVLRKRYHPQWSPPWNKNEKYLVKYEESQFPGNPAINHAVPVNGGPWLVLKTVDTARFPDEIDTMKFLAEEPLGSDPDNRSVHPIDVLIHPTEENLAILVLPLLRAFHDPGFDTIGEALDFILQFFKAIAFLHKNRVSHGDLSPNNVMMDATGMYHPDGFHPCFPGVNANYTALATSPYTRTERPPKYYLIDFGLSRQFGEGETPLASDLTPGTDDTAPEYDDDAKPLNAYFIDVYCAGNMIRKEFIDGGSITGSPGYHHFDFLTPLLSRMTDPDPEKRPSMIDAVSQLERIILMQPSSLVRSRCLRIGGELPSLRPEAVNRIYYWYKRVSYVVKGLPAVPSFSQSADAGQR